MNKEKIEQLWTEMLHEIGEDVNRIGLQDTPKRIAKMYTEIFRGYDKKQCPKIAIFPNNEDGVECKGMVCDQGYFFSQCEHHGVPFFGEYFFTYVPDKKIMGLSKVARIVDFFSAKLQIQERLTSDIVNYIEKEVQPKGICLIIRARHLCKESRGVRKIKGKMTTSEVRGIFEKNKDGIKDEFLSLMGLK